MTKTFRKAVLTAALIGGASGAFAAPIATVTAGFDGVSLRDYNAATFNPALVPPRGGLLIPSDDAIGVSANHVVNWSNGGIGIYLKDGTRLSYQTNRQFLVASGIADTAIPAGQPFDIRLTYDFDSQRYIGLAESGGNNNPIYIVRSNTSDPTAGFKAVQFNTNTPVDFGDFPTLGIDGEAISISVNNFGAAGFSGLGIFSIPKADIIADNPSVARISRFQGFGGALDNFGQGFALQPVNTFGQNDGEQRIFGTSNDFFDELETGTLTFNADNTVASLTFDPSINVLFDGSPRRQPQPVVVPILVDGGDRRISNDVWQVGPYAYMVSTVRERLDPDPARVNRIRLLIIDTRDNSVVEEQLIGINGVDTSYPAIAVNDTGTNFVITFTGSSSTTPLTGYGVACEFNLGSVVRCADPLTLRVSDDPGYFLTFGGTRNRWGDYHDVQWDPADPLSFWVVHNYAQPKDLTEPRGPDFDDRWGNWIARITLDQIAVPEPGAIALFGLGFAGLAAARRRRG